MASTLALKDQADQLLLMARDKKDVKKQAIELVKDVGQLKKDILLMHLSDKIDISLPPTFINHMLNELDQYDHILTGKVIDVRIPEGHPLEHHMLWLPDGVGHSEAIANQLDSVEKEKFKELIECSKEFHDLHMKAEEFIGYLRSGLLDFPGLEKLTEDSEFKMNLLVKIITEIKEMRLSKHMLGTIAPLVLDHMLREECYYLMKLQQYLPETKVPCDPTQPRLEN